MEDQRYTLGYLAGQMEGLAKSLNEHRKEENEVWQRFESKLNSLDNWRSRVIGISVGVSLIVGAVWNFLKG